MEGEKGLVYDSVPGGFQTNVNFLRNGKESFVDKKYANSSINSETVTNILYEKKEVHEKIG